MARLSKGLPWALLALVLLIGGLMVAVESVWFARFLADRASAALGREVTVEGALEVDWSLSPTVRIPPFAVANPQWAGPEPLARAAAAELRLDLPRVLRGRLGLDDVRLLEPHVNLVRTEDRSNWEGMLGDSRNEGRDGRGGFASRVEVDAVSVRDGRLRYSDALQPLSLDLAVRTVPHENGTERLEVEGEGARKGEPFQLRLRGGPLLTVNDPQRPYPIEGWMRSRDTRLQGQGTVSSLLAPDRVDFDLTLAGPNPANLHTLLGLPLPDLPPYRLSGRLTFDSEVWRLRQFNGQVGDSDLAGDLSVRPGDPVMLQARLTSQRLDIDDLLPAFGAPPGTGSGETASPEQGRQAQAQTEDKEVLPEATADRGRLQGVAADVQFRGERVSAPRAIPLEQLEFTLRLREGVLRFDPVRFGVGGGEIRSLLVLDASRKPARGAVDARMEGVDLSHLFEGLDLPGAGLGTIRGRLDARFAGESVDQALGTTDGKLLLFMSSGQVDAVLISLAGLDAGQALLERFFGGGPTEIECAFAHLQSEDGIAKIDRFLIATEEIDLTAAGRINLGKEAMEVAMRGYPRDPTIGASDAPVRLTGRFADADVTVLSQELLARGALAALAAAVAPPLALVPFLHTGTGDEKEDVCAALQSEAADVMAAGGTDPGEREGEGG